jgi:hypothetical protein
VRRGMIFKLEYAAKRLERDLPRFFASGDDQTEEWLASRARGAATALRHLKRNIVVASNDTWDRLAVILRTEIGALAAGDLANIRWTSPPPRKENVKSFWRTPLVAARTVVVMAVPLIATLTLNPILDLAPKTFNIAKVVSVGWAILYFLLTIDPTLQKKIETARSIIGTVQESRTESVVTAQAVSSKQRS